MASINSLLYVLLSSFLASNQEQSPSSDSIDLEPLSAINLRHCPPREHLSECQAHCQKNCTNYNRPTACPDICITRCVCDGGTVRGGDGICTIPKQCSGKDKCPRGEHYDQCYAHCQRNCSKWDKPLSCPLICVHGCVCNAGTVREPNGGCIKPQKCSKREYSEQEELEESSISGESFDSVTYNPADEDLNRFPLPTEW